MVYYMCSRSWWDTAKMYSMRKALLQNKETITKASVTLGERE
jgi:hypothetical protein